MLRVARLAFDIGDQPLGGQRREYALVIDFDDVGALLIEYPRDIVERARLILEPDAQPCEPARPREIAQQHVGEQSRSEEHTSELQSLMRISYAVFCLKKKTQPQSHITTQ